MQEDCAGHQDWCKMSRLESNVWQGLIQDCAGHGYSAAASSGADAGLMTGQSCVGEKTIVDGARATHAARSFLSSRRGKHDTTRKLKGGSGAPCHMQLLTRWSSASPASLCSYSSSQHGLSMIGRHINFQALIKQTSPQA
eukprot:1158963-Pelagomonas_calceolata.AAC.6